MGLLLHHSARVLPADFGEWEQVSRDYNISAAAHNLTQRDTAALNENGKVY